DQARGILERSTDLLEWNARCVGGEERVRPRLVLERGEQRPLGVEILEDRLDDHVGSRNAIAGDVGNQPIERVAGAAWILEPICEELRGALHGGAQSLCRLSAQGRR